MTDAVGQFVRCGSGKAPFLMLDCGNTLMGEGAYTCFFKFAGQTISNTTFTRSNDHLAECEAADLFAAEKLLGLTWVPD